MTAETPDPRDPEKGRAVRGMFASIAPRYDILNRVLSLGLDQSWRRAMVERLPQLGPSDRVLDLCTGTGDVALALAHAGARVHAGDFCAEMVGRAPDKEARADETPHPVGWFVGDALALPYPDDTFAALTVAFGLRNVQHPGDGLAEMVRVLAPGGRLMVLEFSKPTVWPFSALYSFYVFRVLPALGRLFSGSKVDAYRYLPESVWNWPGPEELAAMMDSRGLEVVEQKSFLFGAVILHVADKR